MWRVKKKKKSYSIFKDSVVVKQKNRGESLKKKVKSCEGWNQKKFHIDLQFLTHWCLRNSPSGTEPVNFDDFCRIWVVGFWHSTMASVSTLGGCYQCGFSKHSYTTWFYSISTERDTLSCRIHACHKCKQQLPAIVSSSLPRWISKNLSMQNLCYCATVWPTRWRLIVDSKIWEVMWTNIFHFTFAHDFLRFRSKSAFQNGRHFHMALRKPWALIQ